MDQRGHERLLAASPGLRLDSPTVPARCALLPEVSPEVSVRTASLSTTHKGSRAALASSSVRAATLSAGNEILPVAFADRRVGAASLPARDGLPCADAADSSVCAAKILVGDAAVLEGAADFSVRARKQVLGDTPFRAGSPDSSVRAAGSATSPEHLVEALPDLPVDRGHDRTPGNSQRAAPRAQLTDASVEGARGVRVDCGECPRLASPLRVR